MAARSTGWAMLAAASVQEAHDLALVSHVATLRSRTPFLHFFDGFRTSHEVDKIATLDQDDLRALVRVEDVLAFRGRGMTPESPVVRGTAQNPDVFFQAREAANPYMFAVSGIVKQVMAELGERTGRHYDLVTYSGAPDAERVILIMGSGTGAAQETVETLVARGEKVGMVQVRLFQPFPAQELVAALPATVKSIAVLDRCKEPGAVGEPFYLEAVAAINEAMDGDRPPFAVMPRIIGGRYGLSSKEFTPSMVKPIFDELAADKPKRHFTVGIFDDVTNLSLPIDRDFLHPRPAGEVQAMFFGLGSDGTVGANKASVEDHRRGHGPLLPGPLRVRLQEVGRGDRLAPALRAQGDSLHLRDRRRGLRGLPPVRPAGQDAGPRAGSQGCHLPAQLALWPPTRSGSSCPARCSSRSSRRTSSSTSSMPLPWPTRWAWATASTP